MIYYVIIVLIVIALNEILKRIGILPCKAIPISNVALCICFYIAYSGIILHKGIITGCLIGILTTGIYSSAKNILQWLYR